MAARFRFAFAHDAQLNLIAADKADKLCKDYTCRECGKLVVLCYGDIKQTRHFRHKVQVWAPGEHCDYQDETYTHRHAKAILQQQRWVRVPPVVARRAEGYVGPVATLREARTLEAVHVYNERTVYENAECGLDFQRQKEKFVGLRVRWDTFPASLLSYLSPRKMRFGVRERPGPAHGYPNSALVSSKQGFPQNKIPFSQAKPSFFAPLQSFVIHFL